MDETLCVYIKREQFLESVSNKIIFYRIIAFKLIKTIWLQLFFQMEYL